MDKYDKAARDGAGKYRANNPMPPGTQVQHWTKVISARTTGLSSSTMNRNLSPLQSRNNQPATTLLTDPRGKGTRYTVQGGSSYGNEHKFADRFLINKERANIRAANPNVSTKVEVVAAGEVARWKMTGDPGPSQYTAVRSTYRQGPGNGEGPKPPPGPHPAGPKPAAPRPAGPSRPAGPPRQPAPSRPASPLRPAGPRPVAPPRPVGPPRPAGPKPAGPRPAPPSRSSPRPAAPPRPAGPKPGAMNSASAMPKTSGPKAVGSMNTATKLGGGTASIVSAARITGLGVITRAGFGGIH